MQISVQGEQRVRVAPERAKLSLAVSQEGADRATVIADATAAANLIGRELEALKASGAVERYSVAPLRTYAWKKGPHSPERVTASVDVTARFADFEVLGTYTAEAAARVGVRLGWVNWELTDATADRLRDECIAGAVARARQRAEAMARAAGAGEITIVEVADPGMLGAPESRQMFDGGPRLLAASARGAAAPEPVAVVPQEIEIGALLQLRFVTV